MPYKTIKSPGLLTISLMIALSVSSCVTRKKFDDLNARKLRLETEKMECDEKLAQINEENDKLEVQVKDLSKRCAMLIEDTTQTSRALRKLTVNYDALNDTYEQLLRNHDRLRSFSAAEKDQLSQNLAKRERDLIEAEKRNNELTASLKDREERVKELEKVLEDKEKAVNELRNKVSNALLSFKEKDLTVEIKNGKVYVSLSEQLLFKSGSTAVDAKGADALKKLAEVLKDQTDISVMVEGHTDDVPVSRGTVGVKDNWDLSVLRATEISRILITNGVDPKKVVPAGRGEYLPKAEGKSKDARQKNRRTEIILTPKLDELFKILDAN